MTIKKNDVKQIKSVLIKDNEIYKYQNDIFKLYSRTDYSHYMQSIEWFFCQNKNTSYFYILTFYGNTLVAYSLIYIRNYKLINKAKYFISRGPILENKSYFKPHLEAVVSNIEKNGIYLRLTTYIHGKEYLFYKKEIESCQFFSTQSDSSLYNSTVILDLSDSLQTIRGNFRRSLKTQINKASKQSIYVDEDISSHEYFRFVELHNKFSMMRGFGEIEKNFADCLFRKIKHNPQFGKVLLAKYENEIVAGIILLVSGNRAIYTWGYSSQDDKHNKLPLSHLLHWSGIQWAKNMNLKYYDFGGYWEERGDNDPINRFKTGFSKEIQCFVPEHTLYLSQSLGRLFYYLEKLKNTLDKINFLQKN